MVRQNKAEIVEQGNRLVPRRKARQVRLEELFTVFLRALRPWRPFDIAQDMLCARYSEVRLQLAHAKSLAETIRRIKYPQRETLYRCY